MPTINNYQDSSSNARPGTKSTLLDPQEDENALLISLSCEIAALSNRIDLFDMVNGKIKKLFSITEFGIAQIDEDRKSYSAFVLDLGNAIKDHSDFVATTTASYPVTDRVFTEVMASPDPILYQVNALADEPGVPAYVRFWKDAGVKLVLCGALRVGRNNIGCAFLHLEDDKLITERKNLFNGVFAQLAVAIANILAIEEIALREQERELLLSLNIDIAAARNNDELMRVLNQRLKTLLGFSHTVISMINEDGVTASAYLIDPGTIAKNHPAFEGARQGKCPINDGVLDKAAGSPIPLVYDLAQLREERELPIYFRLNYESGIKQAVVSRFSKRGKAFGFWMVYFERISEMTASKLSLIGGVANQISIAVSNIVAMDEIQSREQEKSKILSFSNAIASVRDKNVLGRILKHQLQELFHIEDYIINAISEDKKRYRPVLYDLSASFVKHTDFQKLINSGADVNDSILDSILCSGNPVTFDADKWFRSLPPFTEASRQIGLKQMMVVPICLGEENIAVMMFRQDELNQCAFQKNLFRSICSQIAITVSNIIANEKVLKQLGEINQYKQQLEEEKIYLKEEIKTAQNNFDIVGNSPEMQKTFQLVAQVASSDSTVLLLGETGTGKELIAHAIHNASPRKDNLMIKVNCAALPANLIESELFGHERGSFTGAIERRIGKFELANNGTLFLDEIGEMPLELQVKLLRALQEREIERVGGRQTIKVNVRIIAATNRDLEKETREGRFRLDLFYRLNIFPICLPPLRERKQDIPALAAYFISRFAHKAGKKISALGSKALHELIQYPWPGNIRELEHLMERSVLLSNGDSIAQIHLPVQKQNSAMISSEDKIVIKTIDENERDHILNILKYCNGRISGAGGAAELLGTPPSTLNSKVKKLGIRKEHSL